MRSLDRSWERVYGRKVVVLAVVLALDFGPEGLHGQNRLTGLSPTMREVPAHDFGLFLQPTGADAEQESTAGVHVQGGDLLGEQQRVPLRHETDAGAQLDLGRDCRRPGKGNEGIDDVGVDSWNDTVRRSRPGTGRCDGNYRVLRHPQRLESHLLGPTGKNCDIDGVVGGKCRNADVHGGSPVIGCGYYIGVRCWVSGARCQVSGVSGP